MKTFQLARQPELHSSEMGWTRSHETQVWQEIVQEANLERSKWGWYVPRTQGKAENSQLNVVHMVIWAEWIEQRRERTSWDWKCGMCVCVEAGGDHYGNKSSVSLQISQSRVSKSKPKLLSESRVRTIGIHTADTARRQSCCAHACIYLFHSALSSLLP